MFNIVKKFMGYMSVQEGKTKIGLRVSSWFKNNTHAIKITGNNWYIQSENGQCPKYVISYIDSFMKKSKMIYLRNARKTL